MYFSHFKSFIKDLKMVQRYLMQTVSVNLFKSPCFNKMSLFVEIPAFSWKEKILLRNHLFSPLIDCNSVLSLSCMQFNSYYYNFLYRVFQKNMAMNIVFDL